MNALAMENASSRTLFHSNPVLSRLSRVTERTDGSTATYAGIASKTAFFLLITLVGVVAQLVAKILFASAPAWQTITVYDNFALTLTKPEAMIVGVISVVGLIAELIGIFLRKTVPVSGTIYAASQGYLISFLVFNVLSGYEYLGLEALLLTVAVVLVMSWLYTSGKVRVCGKFRTVLYSLVIGSIAFGVITFLGSLIPFTRPYVQGIFQNPAVAIGLDLLGILLASLFLISDFSAIDECVKEGYPKEYEWSAAFGLVFTVLWLYLRILELIIRLTGDSKK